MDSKPLVYLAQPSTVATTWRTLWPGLELRRRGYRVLIDSMDAGYVPEEPPEGATTVLHLTPSLWAHPLFERRVEAIVKEAQRSGRLIVQLDDDWTRVPEILKEERHG